MKVCGNPALSKSVGIIFPMTFAHFASLSHFDNSHNASDFSVIVTLVTVVCDQWSLMLSVQKGHSIMTC